MSSIRIAPLVVVAGVMIISRDARASNIDIDSGDSYPTRILITSPSGQSSELVFNNSYSINFSDANFLIDATFNSTSSVNTFNSVTITAGINTGDTISTVPVLASLVWESTGTNSGSLNAANGHVSMNMSFHVDFTGAWLGGGESCSTGSFTVTMSTSGTHYPYWAPPGTGTAYSSTSGTFTIVSSAVGIPDIAGMSCTPAHIATLTNDFSLGVNSNAGMKIDKGYPVYAFDSQKVHGS